MGKFEKSLIILILGLFLISFVSAQPPFEAGASFFTNGLVIEFSQLDVHELNKDVTFNAHVFNISNGVLLKNDTVDCMFDLFKEDGGHLIKQIEMPFDLDGSDWEILVDGGNFTISEEYSYLISCNSSALGGFVSVGFEISPDGSKVINEGRGEIILAGVLVLIALVAFFCLLGTIINNTPIKVFFFSLSSLLLIGSVGFMLSSFNNFIGQSPGWIGAYKLFYILLVTSLSAGAVLLILYLIVTAFSSLASYRTQVERA